MGTIQEQDEALAHGNEQGGQDKPVVIELDLWHECKFKAMDSDAGRIERDYMDGDDGDEGMFALEGAALGPDAAECAARLGTGSGCGRCGTCASNVMFYASLMLLGALAGAALLAVLQETLGW